MWEWAVGDPCLSLCPWLYPFSLFALPLEGRGRAFHLRTHTHVMVIFCSKHRFTRSDKSNPVNRKVLCPRPVYVEGDSRVQRGEVLLLLLLGPEDGCEAKSNDRTWWSTEAMNAGEEDRTVKPSQPYNPWLWCRAHPAMSRFPFAAAAAANGQAQVEAGIKLYFHFPLHSPREIGAQDKTTTPSMSLWVGGGGRGGELISVHLANGQTIFAYHAETGHNIHNVQYNDDMSTRCYCLRGRQYQRPLFVLHSSMERKRREGPRSVPSLHAQIGMSLFYVPLLKIITEDVCNPLLNWMLGDEEEDGMGSFKRAKHLGSTEFGLLPRLLRILRPNEMFIDFERVNNNKEETNKRRRTTRESWGCGLPQDDSFSPPLCELL